MTLTPADLRSGELVYQLEIDWPAETIRVSDVEHEAPFGEDSAIVQFHGVLDIGDALAREIDLFSAEPASKSVTANVNLYEIIDVPATVEASGGPLLVAARLYVYPLNSTKRLLLIKGTVQSYTYDHAGAPLVLEIEQAADDDQGTLLQPVQYIGPGSLGTDGTTWNWDPNTEGEFYPVIIGKPGDGNGTAFGSPAFGCNRVSPSLGRMLVAAHRVAATSVYAENFTNNASGTRNIDESYADENNAPISLIDVVGWATPTWNDGDETWVDWGASAGGIEVDGSLLQGAGDVMRWALRQSTLEWDAGRLGAIRKDLNRFLIDTAITAQPGERIRPWEWLTANVLPLLPVSVVYGPDGLYPVLWRPDAPATDAVVALEALANCERISAVQPTNAAMVRNDFTVNYGLDARRNRTTKRTRLCGDLMQLELDDDSRLEPLCRRSFARFGSRPKVVRAESVWDDATADRITRWMAAAFSMPSRRVDYRIDPDLLWLEPGDVVTLTDAEVSLSSHVGLIERVGLNALEPNVTVRLYETA